MREEISDELRARVLHRDNFMCRYCGVSVHRFDIDHVYPVVKGGETTFDNLVTACPRCNRKKNGRVGIWPKPIGYFSKRPKINDVSILNVLILAFGISLVSSGFVNIEDSYMIGRILILSGICVLLISFGRFATGR